MRPIPSDRLRSEDHLVDVVKNSDRRKALVKSVQRKRSATYGTDGAHIGVVDVFHGETHFGVDAPAAVALDRAFRDLVSGAAKLTESDGTAYDKRSPRILRELAARHLFDRLKDPAPNVPGVEVTPDEVVVCPYSSTMMLEEAFATVAEPRGFILSPEGFYKSNALHVAKYGLKIRTIPRADSSFKLEPEKFRQAIQLVRRHGPLCAVLFTVPGNPIVVEYTLPELYALAQVIADEDVRVITDAGFDKCVERYTPLASLRVKVGNFEVALYDHILTLTGNSKGYNAFGPCKFGAACTGDPDWRNALNERMTVLFQRETTHLARALFEHTTEEYFAANRRTMQAQQELARSLVDGINQRNPPAAVRVFPPSTSGMFLNIEFDASFMARAGVKTSLVLEDMLLLAQGVDSTCLVRMGSPILAVRFNVLSPRKHGKKDPTLLHEVFNRVEAFVANVRDGLTYETLTRSVGLNPIEQDDAGVWPSGVFKLT